MKVMIFLCAWKRPEITKACYKGIHRIKKTFAKNGVEADVFVTVSEDYHAELAEQNGFKWIMTDNSPVGQKHHNGLMAAMIEDWDYIMQLGSDDLISDHYIDECCKELGKHHVLGSNYYYFYDIANKEVASIMMKGNAPGGAGRFVRRDIIQACIDRKGFFWQRHLNKGLDRSSWKAMCWANKDLTWKTLEFNEPILVDIKSKDSMNNYEIMISGAHKIKNEEDPENPKHDCFRVFTESVFKESDYPELKLLKNYNE